MKVLASLETRQRRSLLNLFITGLLFWTSITSLLPVLPAYVIDVGGTPQDVGLVTSCFAIGLLGFRTNLGKLADEKGRKIVVLIGTLVVGIPPLIYTVVTSIPLLMVLRAFHGISIAAFTTGYSAWVTDLSPIKQRGEILGYMTLATPVGMALGPAMGGYLANSSDFGYKACFVTAGVMGLLAFVCASSIAENGKTGQISKKKLLSKEINRNFSQLITNRSLIIPAIVLFLVGAIFGTLVAFLPLFVRDSGLDFNPGLFYTAAAIGSFSIRVLAGKASDSLGRGVLITLSLVCYVVAMVLLSVVRDTELLIGAGLIEGVGAGIIIPTIIALITDRTHPAERGKAYALCLTGFDAGTPISSLILGYLIPVIGFQGAFTIAAVLGALALIIFLTQSSNNVTNSFAFALGKIEDIYKLED